MRIVVLKLLIVGLAVAGASLAWKHREAVLEKNSQRSNVLQGVPPEAAAIEQRTLAKRQLARRLLAERTPLLDAAELFNLVNGEEGTLHLTRSVPGRSLREKLCRQVISYVECAERDMECEGYPRAAVPVSDELQRELDRRLAAGEFAADPVLE